MKASLAKIKSGDALSFLEAQAIAEWMLLESSDAVLIAEILVALKTKKETSDEIEGFLAAIRATSVPFPKLGDSFFSSVIDVCGTGGDGINTFNVSTGVAIVLGSLGHAVAKHGNRSVSSLSGSSDVLQALGIQGDVSVDGAISSLHQHKISFLHAPAFYPVLAKLAPIRKSIPGRTLFNALGPLLNPAPITHQLMGVYDPSLLEIAALSMKKRGIKHALVVHGSDGLDELTLSGETHALRLQHDKISALTLTPEDFGLSRAEASEVKGGNPAENAQILLHIYRGQKSAKRNLLVMNAAAALALLEGHHHFKESVAKVESALDSGVTLKFVQTLRQKT